MLRLRKTPQGGRSVFLDAPAEIPPGTVLFHALPYAHVIEERNVKEKSVCWNCLCHRNASRDANKWTKPILRCTARGSGKLQVFCGAAYCSAECMQQDACLHERLCPLLRDFHAEMGRRRRRRRTGTQLEETPIQLHPQDASLLPSDIVDENSSLVVWDGPVFKHSLAAFLPDANLCDLLRLILMALVRRTFENSSRTTSDSPVFPFPIPPSNTCVPKEPNFGDVLQMQDNQTHYEALTMGGHPDWSHVLAYQFLRHVVRVPHDILGSDSTFFRNVLYREMANSFGLWDDCNSSTARSTSDTIDQYHDPVSDASELLGFAIFPHATFFNHSCRGNLGKRMRGKVLEFVTLERIRPGDELCISYGCMDDIREMRQARLKREYFFDCQCKRCTEEWEAEVGVMLDETKGN